MSDAVESKDLTGLVLYAYQGRSRAERVIWMLNELGLQYELVRLDYRAGDTRKPEFLQWNPSGKVPVLRHGDLALTESVAILQYMDRVCGNRLSPSGAFDRYLYDSRMLFLLTEIEPYLWIADQARYIGGRYQWPEGTVEGCLRRLQENMPVVIGWLDTQDYVVGTGFTVADILAYHLLTWWAGYEESLSSSLAEYFKRLESRSGFPATMARVGSPARTG